MGGGVVKENGRGGWWNPMTFILSISEMFDKIYASNFLCIDEITLQKSHVSMIFSQNLIFANFHVYFQCIQISEGALTLWR